jgi:hypothetical protein
MHGTTVIFFFSVALCIMVDWHKGTHILDPVGGFSRLLWNFTVCQITQRTIHMP